MHCLLRLSPFLLLLFVVLSQAHGSVSADLGKQSSSQSFARTTRRQASPQRKRADTTVDEKFFKFITRPDIGAPRWNIKVYDKDAIALGYWFVAPYAALDQREAGSAWNGPHIYDSTGTLIWSGAPFFDHFNTFDFRTVKVGGENMLSLIFPHDNHHEGVILDSSYNLYSAVDLRGKLRETNMHDFTVVDDGQRALTLSNVPGKSTIEQSRVIGFEGNCSAGWEGFNELRVEDSKLLFEWSARDWFGLDESTFTPKTMEHRCDHGWDILHLNSVDKSPDGDYIISSRHMDAVYKISHVDGHIVWRLGGKKSDFHFEDNAARFSRQHHVRVRSQNETHMVLSIFDNAVGSGPAEAEHPTSDVSRGLLLELRTIPPMTVQLLAHYDHPLGGHTNSRGSMQLLPNGNFFMGWTYSSRESEHSPDGKVLMEANFRNGAAHSYRNYKYPWVGRPTAPPDVHTASVDTDDGGVSTIVHVSWNGATEVASWNLYKTSADGASRVLVATTSKQGFETGLSFAGYAAYVVVEGLDKDGRPLDHGESEVMKTIEPINMQSPDVVVEMQWLQHNGNKRMQFRLTGLFRTPVVVYLLGFVSCAAVFGLARWMLFYLRNSHSSAASWWSKQGLSGYELAPRHSESADDQLSEHNEDYETSVKHDPQEQQTNN